MRVYFICAVAVASICAHGEEKEGKAIYEQRVLESFALPGIGVVNPMCSSIEWCSQSNSIGAVETAKQGLSFEEMVRELEEKCRTPKWRLFLALQA